MNPQSRIAALTMGWDKSSWNDETVRSSYGDAQKISPGKVWSAGSSSEEEF